MLNSTDCIVIGETNSHSLTFQASLDVSRNTVAKPLQQKTNANL